MRRRLVYGAGDNENGIRGLQGHRFPRQGAPTCRIGQTAHQEAVHRRENAGCDPQQSEPAGAETSRDHGDRSWQDAAYGEWEYCYLLFYQIRARRAPECWTSSVIRELVKFACWCRFVRILVLLKNQQIEQWVYWIENWTVLHYTLLRGIYYKTIARNSFVFVQISPRNE